MFQLFEYFGSIEWNNENEKDLVNSRGEISQDFCAQKIPAVQESLDAPW